MVSTELSSGQSEPKPLVVYRLLDARPGHEKQTLGLVQGLAAHTSVRLREYQLFDQAGGALDSERWAELLADGAKDPPDLIVGAGHALHLPMLWFRWRRGGRAVVLMKPTLPLWCFDLVLAPEHDLLGDAPNLLRTQGMLCPVVTREDAMDGRAPGLILVGGVNRYFSWHSARVARQISQLVAAAPAIDWTVTDSRRTPDDFPAELAQLTAVPFVPWQETSPDWLPTQLGRASNVWVTADSASMLYEALASGARVGVIELPGLRPGSKLQRGIERLLDRGTISLSTHQRVLEPGNDELPEQ